MDGHHDLHPRGAPSHPTGQSPASGQILPYKIGPSHPSLPHRPRPKAQASPTRNGSLFNKRPTWSFGGTLTFTPLGSISPTNGSSARPFGQAHTRFGHEQSYGHPRSPTWVRRCGRPSDSNTHLYHVKTIRFKAYWYHKPHTCSSRTSDLARGSPTTRCHRPSPPVTVTTKWATSRECEHSRSRTRFHVTIHRSTPHG
jgi:hypothetical protein